MGLPWTIKESVTGLYLKEERGNGQRLVMGSQGTENTHLDDS
jgi:hypothetical protein